MLKLKLTVELGKVSKVLSCTNAQFLIPKERTKTRVVIQASSVLCYQILKCHRYECVKSHAAKSRKPINSQKYLYDMEMHSCIFLGEFS